MSNSNTPKQIATPIMVVTILIIGIFIGRLTVNKLSINKLDKNSQEKLNLLLGTIETNYVEKISISNLIENAIPKILENLDPHSIYIPAKDMQAVSEPLEGSFDGIGVQFNIQNDTVIIISVISGGPAEKMGVLAGDRIITIEDTIFAGKKITNEDVFNNLKGKKGSKVKIGIKRQDVKEIIHFVITRDKIPIHSIDISHMVNNDIGYIKINRFARNTHQEFVDGIKTLHNQGMKKLIIDIRGNGGGYLDAATKIADEILPEKNLIVYTEGRARTKKEYFAKSGGICEQDQIVVLIDTWSASASEILAGAIQDNDRGLVIGRRSFGKGLVQETFMFYDTSAVRLTISKYYTPSGRCIQKPYDHGSNEYEAEIFNRIKKEDQGIADSTLFADSLKYQTTKGKIVYGGGGIMPDIFVAIDTSFESNFLRKIIAKGTIYNFALKYTDSNRKKLLSYSNYEELLIYLEKSSLYNEFLLFNEKSGIKIIESEELRSRTYLKNQLQALICRNIFNNEGFYPVLEKLDNVFLKAIEILTKNSMENW